MSEEYKKVKDDRIPVIETIRGLAALSVCLFHFTKTNIRFPDTAIWFKKLFSYGWLGVEAFFVVSGFIIVYSLVKSGYTVKLFFRFFLKRCLRIEPPYLISIIVVLVLGYLSSLSSSFRGEPFQLNAGQILSHVAYLPEHLGYKWLLPVYWSLEAEFHYYILIGLLLPYLWKNNYTLLAGFAAGLIASYFIHLYVFSYMPLFIMGIAAAAYKTGKIKAGLYFTVLAFCFAVSVHRGQLIVIPITGLITSLIIVWMHYSDPVTAFLGKISFSLYLIHVPVGGRLLNYAGRYADTDWKVWLSIIVTTLFTIFVSWLFYKMIEYPSLLLSKKLRYN